MPTHYRASVCEYCGDTTTTVQPLKRYCSRRCKELAREKRKRDAAASKAVEGSCHHQLSTSGGGTNQFNPTEQSNDSFNSTAVPP